MLVLEYGSDKTNMNLQYNNNMDIKDEGAHVVAVFLD